MKINVLEFLPVFEDAGAQRVITNYCRYIDKSRFSIIVLSVFAIQKGSLYYQIKNANCSIFSIFKIIKNWDSSLLIRLLKKIFLKRYVSLYLKRVLIKNKINVIHAHIDVLKYINVIRKFINKNKIKVMYTCHNIPTKWLGEQYVEEHNAAISLLKDSKFSIYALHNEMRDEIKTMLKTEKVYVLENPIDFDQIKSQLKPREIIRKELNIPNSAFVIGDFCSLTKPKNLLFLVEIFKKCFEFDSNCYLLLVCHGKPLIKNQIIDLADKYRIIKNIKIIENKSEVYQYLNCLDVFCSPSLYEGFGLSLLEAQIVGINSVFSNTHPSEINLLKNNIVCSLNDSPEIWAKSILSLKNKKSSFNPNINKYNISVVIKKIEKLYNA